MTLTNPGVEYKTIRDAILTLLQANMATLNTALTGGTFTANAQIIGGDPMTTPIPNTLYPVIMVKIVNKTEAFIALGNAGRKRPVVTFRLFGITRKVSGVTDDEIMLLTKNIESVLRNNIEFNANILYSGPTNTDFVMGELEGTYVDIVAIDLECVVEVK